MEDILIDIKNLTWGYKELPFILFNKFNFSLFKNDFCVIMGKSGSGKSSLVKLIIGQIMPPARTIFHKKEDISKYSDLEMQNYRKKIGIVFQDYRLFDNLTVKENIQYPLKLYKLGQTIIENKTREMIKKFDLQKHADISIKFLSTGEKQKVAIARALIHNPEFLIADEPTGNLNWEHTQQMADEMITAHTNSNNTILLITHDIHLVNYLKAKHKIRLYSMG